MASEDLPLTSAPLDKTPDALKTLVKDTHVLLQARLRADHVVYSQARTHLGNSQILFYPSGDRSVPAIPGQIEYIFSIGRIPRFAVRRYSLAKLDRPDPFTRWPDFPARLWSSHLSDRLEEVHTSWVLTQFARYGITEDHVVVVDLSQVSTVIANARVSTNLPMYS
ncbi:hypothetical protein C8Q76DRAFT_608220 [Earliella scabrosa]|nr:hypothetical protein C8Q76DRAFT_608220 [Earliella scabrosa]